MVDRVGQDLGNYRLVEKLGEGAFADVYKGEHHRLKSLAAIKILRGHVAGEEEFLREAQIIASLEHRNIVRIFDFVVQEGIPFIVMQYAVNGSLRQRHPRGKTLTLPTIINYLIQIAEGLQHAHDQRIMHRDIKPENLLLGRNDELLVSDFGIALMVQSLYIQSPQAIGGTPPYMAPEQFEGEPHRASDQYALAIIAYEWLVGERPFSGTFGELHAQHRSKLPPPICLKVPTLSLEIDNVIQKALAKNPDHRFPSVKAFALALQEAGQVKPLFPVERPAIEPLRQSKEKPVLPFIEQPFIEPARPPREKGKRESIPLAKQPPVLPLPELSPKPATIAPSKSFAKSPVPPVRRTQESVSQMPFVPERRPPAESVRLPQTGQPLVPPAHPVIPVSKRIVRAKPILSRRVVIIGGLGALALGVTGLYMYRPFEGKLLFTYTGHKNTVKSVSWSSDGKSIASASTDTTVQVWSALDGSTSYVYRGHTGWVKAAAWSPNAHRIASVGDDGTVQVWNALDGGAASINEGHRGPVVDVAWSPDGRRVASAGYDRTVQIWDVDNGSVPYSYRGHSGWVVGVAWSPNSQRIASASYDGTVQIWNVDDGSTFYTYGGHSGQVLAVAWSPDGRRIASVGIDTTVQVWDTVDGKVVYIYRGNSAWVGGVAWSPDGLHIASAGSDGTVQIWNAIDTGDPYIYRGHHASVNTVVWSPDGSSIASGGDDNTVKVWHTF